MSLGIAFKGPEGIVLAADSRVTLTAQLKRADEQTLLHATYDNATKLLRVAGQDFVGVVTYGIGAIGGREPRTAHSFIPEFEASLDEKRLSVSTFAKKLSTFFMERWKETMPPAPEYSGGDMKFLIGGYDKDKPYGTVLEVGIPGNPVPFEWHRDSFGAVFGGQQEVVGPVMNGFDPRLIDRVKHFLELPEERAKELGEHLKAELAPKIPYPFLPLQDCVDLSIFLVRATATLQGFQVAMRGVGGAIDVATITRTHGFQPVQEKKIVGERRQG